MTPQWNELPAPLDLGEAHEADLPFPVDQGIQLRMDDGEVVLLGDWGYYYVTSDPGCGCCSGARHGERVIAWRDWREVLNA